MNDLHIHKGSILINISDVLHIYYYYLINYGRLMLSSQSLWPFGWIDKNAVMVGGH